MCRDRPHYFYLRNVWMHMLCLLSLVGSIDLCTQVHTKQWFKKKSPGSTLLSTCGLFLDLPCWDEMKRTLVMSCWCPDSPVSNALFSGLSHSLHARSRANFAPAGAKHRWWGHSLTPGWVLAWPYPSRLTKHLLAGYTLQHSKYKYPKIWLLVLVCKLNENPGINSD